MENVTETGPVSAEEAAATAQPELSVNDLFQVRAVVELAVRRGVFQANELSTVGAIYDRLNNFLNAVAPPAPQNAEVAADNDQTVTGQ
jgi:hypothetical protein